jgi:hypothetical protein
VAPLASKPLSAGAASVALCHVMRIRAFQGLIPCADLAAELASPPYDVLDTAEAREIIADVSGTCAQPPMR